MSEIDDPLTCECGQKFTRPFTLKRHRENAVCENHKNKKRKLDPLIGVNLSCRDEEAEIVKALNHCSYIK